MNKFLAGFALVVSIILNPVVIYAQYYGFQSSQPNRQILVDKKILNPQSGMFVDNLSVDSFQFLPDQEATFRILVQNTIQSKLNGVVLKDVLPSQVSYVSSPGSFDPNSNTVNINVGDLNPDESRTYDVKVKVKSADQIPTNVTCLTNLAEVSNDQTLEQDTATFCVQKQILGVTSELPRTGPNGVMLILAGSILTLLLSLISFKIAKIK